MINLNCAIMFADISDSTHLYEQLGDSIAQQCIGDCLEQLTQIITTCNGMVVKIIGDELMCRFERVSDAVIASQVSQQKLQSLHLHDGTHISIRIGMHCGEVIEENADIFGDVVNIASRMVKIAKSGQIIATEDVANQLSPPLITQIRKVDVTRIKGKQGMSAVYEVLWEHNDELTGMDYQRLPRTTPDLCQKLKLYHTSSICEMTADSKNMTIGRNKDCDLYIDAAFVSRQHADCKLRRNKFIFTDQSTNGTYLTLDGGPEIYLRHEEFVLLGEGLISLGKPRTESIWHSLIRYRTYPGSER